MAAVAVAGVASAQVSITGKYAFGFTSDETNAGVATTGLGVTDGHLTFAASEDLGGGLSISASSEFVSRGRDTLITGRNASMTVAGGFGSVMMGSVSDG